MSYKNIHLLTFVTKGKISNIDQNHFLYQFINMFFSAVKLCILTLEVMGLTPFRSQSMNYSCSHVRVVSGERAGGCRLVSVRKGLVWLTVKCCLCSSGLCGCAV